MSQETYDFFNCRGEKVTFPASATMEDLLRAGVREIRFVPKDSPLDADPQWYTDVCPHSATVTVLSTQSTTFEDFRTNATDAC